MSPENRNPLQQPWEIGPSALGPVRRQESLYALVWLCGPREGHDRKLTWPLGAEVARLTVWPSRALEESAEAMAIFALE